ncbi:hypothetical protein GGU45_001686 [Niabella hirudinis]
MPLRHRGTEIFYDVVICSGFQKEGITFFVILFNAKDAVNTQCPQRRVPIKYPCEPSEFLAHLAVKS